jgi:hypothetical protein
VPVTCAVTVGAVVSSPPPPPTVNSPTIVLWPGMVQWNLYLPGVSVTVASWRPLFASNGLATMFSDTSLL